MESKLKILVVEDDKLVLETIELEIGDEATLTMVTDIEEAMNLLVREDFDIVLSDFDLKHDMMTGLNVVKRAITKNPFVTASLMTGTKHGSLIKQVFDVFNGLLIEKPFKKGVLQDLLKRGEYNRIRKHETLGIRNDSDPFHAMIAETPSIIKIIEQIRKWSTNTSLSIHFSGSTGVGKTTFVKGIHQLSGLKSELVIVNCADIAELPMSRLFGHVKGSFTGAISDHTGYIEQANKGTLFLDEFHLLSREVQGKLLHVLDGDGEYQKLGGTHKLRSQFRIITAASINVRELADKNEFSPDLWYRVSQKIVEVPSLSERKACIPRIVHRSLAAIGAETKCEYGIESAAMDLIMLFSWGGNIRDLTNSLKSMCADLAPGQKINADMVREDLQKRSGSFGDKKPRLNLSDSFNDAISRYQIALISDAFRKNKGSVTLAAKALSMPRTSLQTRCNLLKFDYSKFSQQ